MLNVLCSDEGLMQWVGFNAQPARQGICQRGATTRQGTRLPGPIGPDTLAKLIGRWHVRHLGAVCNGGIRARAQAGGVGAKVRGNVDGMDLETTAHDTGCGHVTRQRCLEDQRSRMHEIDVTVYGWQVFLLLDATTKMPWAGKVGPIQAHEALWTQALVTHARRNLAGSARLHKDIFEKGFLDGPTR